MRLYAETERIAPAEEPQAYRWCAAGEPHVSRFGGAGAIGPQPKKLLHTLREFGAHGSYYKGWEKDCQNGGND
jgi:hypothetical protein